jgi:hypothetical protein
VSGPPGCGKSAALRILSESPATQRDVTGFHAVQTGYVGNTLDRAHG